MSRVYTDDPPEATAGDESREAAEAQADAAVALAQGPASSHERACPSCGNVTGRCRLTPDGKSAAACWKEALRASGSRWGAHYPSPEAEARVAEEERRRQAERVFSASDPRPTARQFLSDNEPTYYVAGTVYRWNGTAYAELPPDALNAELWDYLERAQKFVRAGEREVMRDFAPKPRDVSAVSEALRALAYRNITPPCWLIDGDNPDPRGVIVGRNAIILVSPDGEPRIVGKPTPDFFTLNALDYDYHAAAPEPRQWLKFLVELWPDDPASIELLQQWVGYLLSSDTSLQKMLLIAGPPRSGKGTIARVITALIGAANVCAPSLGSLATNFGLWALIGKSLGIVADARLSGRTDMAVVVERLLNISGEDAVTIDRKNLQPITMRLPTRLMLLTNELPRLADASGALANRFLILQLRESHLGREDHNLAERLLTELPGILKWALTGLRELRRNGRFIPPTSSEEALEEMIELASPVSAFVDELCRVGNGETVPAGELYDAWCGWSAEQGRSPGASNVFARDIHAAVPSIRTINRREGELRKRHYDGIRLTEVGRVFSEKTRVVRNGTRSFV